MTTATSRDPLWVRLARADMRLAPPDGRPCGDCTEARRRYGRWLVTEFKKRLHSDARTYYAADPA